jgi:hypothetical protein
VGRKRRRMGENVFDLLPMAFRGQFRYFFVPLILSNGQSVVLRTVLYGTLNVKVASLPVANDWVANRLWKSIDEPKVILTLVRFDRKFLQK